jgi:GNAT superfamily N-acetyltransferase
MRAADEDDSQEHRKTRSPPHGEATVVDEWGRNRASDLAALVEAALPDEELSADELLGVCWDDPGVVFAAPEAQGAVSVSLQDHGGRGVGFIKLIAVVPEARRQGIGRALLEAAHGWCFDRGANEVRVGAAAPFYLWPGCDVAHLDALCLFEQFGYWAVGAELNMSCPTRFRAGPPPGVSIVRALDEPVLERGLALVRREWPGWEAEMLRAIEQGCCHVAIADDDDSATPALGFACHSVNRAGWIGPMGTDPTRQHRGVGSALLGQLCRDLQAAEFVHAEIAWVGPVSFYAKAADARVSRVFRSLMLPRPAAHP